MSKPHRNEYLPTQPAAHWTGPSFEETKTPEEFFQDSTRDMLDPEFSADVPRDAPTFADRVLVLVIAGCALGTVWAGISALVLMFGG